MSLSEEEGASKFGTAEERAYRSIKSTVSEVIKYSDLPPQVRVLVYDQSTRGRFASIVTIERISDSGLMSITIDSVAKVDPTVTSLDIADILLKIAPDAPLVCDRIIADEILRGSIPWFEKEGYVLAGRPTGVLQIFTP